MHMSIVRRFLSMQDMDTLPLNVIEIEISAHVLVRVL